ncbi:MAG TPA: hypothetical protein VGM69_06900 [Chloroflexota bacterium]|jgi:hypothetical protein
MPIYSFVVFLHVVGALGLFVAMGLEWVTVTRVRRAETAEQARDWLGLLGVIRWLSPASMAAILLAGIYMTATVWGGVGWIVVAFVALLLLPPLGIITLRRLPKISEEMASERGPLSEARREQLADPLLLVSIQTRTAIALGIVFLMTNKPDAVGSAIAIVVAAVLGLAFSLPALKSALRARGPAPTPGSANDAGEESSGGRGDLTRVAR